MQQVVTDLKTFSSQDLHVLGRYYNINTNIDHSELITQVATKIISANNLTWQKYCNKNYIPNVIDNTRIHLTKEIAAGKQLCDLVKGLPRIGNPSSTAKIFDYNPTASTSAVIKVVPITENIEKELLLSQLLSGKSMFPYVFMSGRCNSNYYIVMEKLGLTFGDLINQHVSIKTIKKVIRDVLDAIKVMKSYGISHTDLKPDNIMLRCTGANSYQTVIIDFDLVNDASRDLDKYSIFDVYDFMRRLHDLSNLELLYPNIHKKVTDIYLKLDKGDKRLTRMNIEQLKNVFN